ncbi:MAG: hypothetical protein ACM3ZE_19370, partial [Myxococcales bacterium]
MARLAGQGTGASVLINAMTMSRAGHTALDGRRLSRLEKRQAKLLGGGDSHSILLIQHTARAGRVCGRAGSG